MSAQSLQIISRLRDAAHPRSVPSVVPPPLNAGDRLSRAEFERRYQANPEIKKAELIEGVVHMESTVRFEQHGRPHSNIITWYRRHRYQQRGLRLAQQAPRLCT